MPSGSLNHAAALSLLTRALNSGKQSEATLLIDAAQRLDPAINAEDVKNQWLEKWIKANQNRIGESSQ